MDPAAAEFYEGEGEDLDPYDFQPLPTLPEDEENVSLADILSLRDRGLGEREAWAVCLECCLAMRSVAHAALFHTLCITPDTLAFNTSGNVCFMEQLSDDPEGAFVPPEFDVTGNTFEAHIYSLGATLKAALEYGAEPEPRPSHDLELLLSQMQAEDPGNRPDLESIIALCEEKVPATSSCRQCRSLSAVGRRVLSIESFGAFPDVSESSWRGRPAPRSLGPRRPPGDLEADAEAPPTAEAPGKSGGSPVGRGPREARTAAEGPQASAPCLSAAASGFQPPDPRKALPEGTSGPSSLKAQPRSPLRPEPELPQKGARSAGRSGDAAAGTPGPGPMEGSPPPRSEDARHAGQDPASFGAEEWLPEGAREPGSAAAEQGVSLQDLLSKLGRPFREYELWALSHACLSTLRTHRRHPAYLCPDSVLVAEDGAVLFGLPPANGTYNAFFLAPEVAEQKLVTEKASVYCVAAVLWTAAKFSIPREHKLALPRRLKTLLLHMARRSAQERPSAAEAIKVCGTYLLQRGMDSRKILAHLRASTCKVHPREETIGLQNTYVAAELSPSTAPAPSSGFVHVSGDTSLVAVQGPVPGPPSGCTGAWGLPAAFTSAATHFKPIVLAPPAGAARDTLAPPLGLAERPQERPGWPDGDVGGQEASKAHTAATSLEVPDLLAPGPGPQGAAPKPPEEVVPRDPAQGCPCPPAPASSVTPLTVGEQVPPGVASGGLKPCPPSPSAAPCGPQPPARPPGSKASDGDLPAGPDAPDGEHGQRAPDSTPCPCSVDAPPLPRGTACPSLQEATRLIQEEFAFDGYLDNGLEALIMGEYIYALKDLTYATFCGAVAEKFCDLYWGERLLQSLFRVVNGSALEEAASQPMSGGQASARGGCSPTGQRPPRPGAGRETPAAHSRASCTSPALSGLDSDELSRGNLEVGFRPPGAAAATAGEGGQQAGGPEAAARPPQPEEGAPTEFQAGSPGWGSAFHEADCFGADVRNYARELGQRRAGGAPRAPSPTALLEPECRQELEQQLVMEKRNYRKTLKFYQKLLQKEKRSKGSEVKTMLCRLKGQLEEMRSKVQLLGLVKKYLQVLYAERWGLEPCALPVVVNVAATHCDTLDFSPLDESSSLIFYSVSKHARGGHRRARELQAGTPLGLMAYLYSSGAFLEGYVQQFLYTFRYFCTPQDLLHFLLDRISSALPRAQQDPTSTFTKIYKRSFCLLQAWVEDCYTVDFAQNAGLLGRLQDFLSSKILPPDGSAERLLGLLGEAADQRAEGAPRGTDLEGPREAEEDVRPLNAFCKRLSEDGISRKSFPWRLARGNGLALPLHKEHQYSIAAALPKPCFFEDVCGPYTKASAKGPYFLTEYSTHQLFSQLTLLQQELFQKCHPVHFLNSRALGVTDKSVAVPRTSSESLPAKTCSLFLPSYVQDKYLLHLLHSADDVSTWVAAEIVTCHSSKLQVTLLSKFLLIAKSCYEQRNFATAMQILGGLEHLAVRQCPAWRILPAKMAEVMEELKAVEVFLKSDSLCLMEGRRFRAQPTLPAARLLAMHVQQLETGGFTMTNGAHRWSKLRNIAKVASQVHAFQENPYTFAADPKLQSCLRQRVACFSGADVSVLAADRGGGFPPAAGEKQSRRIQDKLRRMKATFQ